MINVEGLKNERKELFKKTFDFESFDSYITNHFKDGKKTHLGIGISCDWQTEDWAKKNGRECLTLAFDKGHSNYIWATNIQVAQSIDNFVVEYLKENGFNVTQKGACGYNHYDVIVISL
jgi:hypothetical protein